MKAALCVLVMLGLAGLSASASTEETAIPTTAASGETTPTPPASCSAEISDQCPDIDGDVPVILPDPTDCGKFCECSNGVAISLVCPPGTLFDETLGVCATDSEVDCGDRPDDD